MVAYFHCVLNKAPICLPNAMNNGYMPYDEIVDLGHWEIRTVIGLNWLQGESDCILWSIEYMVLAYW